MLELQDLNKYRENNRIEVKQAEKGLPKSLWETYSSFANTLGGIILLGITEHENGIFEVTGIDRTDALIKDFWNLVNNHQKVNVNLLNDEDVIVFENGELRGIAINVPRANRHQKPVYINGNIMNGTFRRNGDGDYHCTDMEVKNMLRDQADVSQDLLVLDEMELDVLDFESIRKYRTRLENKKPGHVWNDLDDRKFLYRIGAVAESREDKQLHPTIAGLLMFGYEYEIVKVFPNYFLDYQECMDEDIRWTDRIVSSSGEWSGNLYDFYFKVYNRIAQDIKVPFKLENGTDRVDDTPMHEAIREALANALIHASYYERRGLVIKRMKKIIRIENPGALRITIEEALRGGNSDPRNETIFKMFNLLTIGERAGSGIPNIYKVWQEENLKSPLLEEHFSPDRTIFILPLEKVTKNREKKSGEKIGRKNREKALVSKTSIQLKNICKYLNENESCTRVNIEELLDLKPSRAGQLLSMLVEEGKVVKTGNTRNIIYKIVK